MLKSVFLEVTRKCNMNCLFCSNPSRKALSQELSKNEFLSIISSLHNFGITDLRFYGGEPFLYPDVFEIITKARDYGVAVSIYTNGTILDEQILDNLKGNQVRKLFLSVDSHRAEVNDKIRGVGGGFEQVITNIQTLVNAGLVIDVLFTICRLNKDDIEETYHLLHSLGVNDVKANFVSKVGKAKENWNQLSLTASELKQCMFEINKTHFALFGRSPVRKRCQAATEEIFIAANGDVFPCALFLEPEYLAGNLKQKSLQEIWNNPGGLFGQLRDIISNKKYCKSCNRKEDCGGGCRARAVAMSNGNLLASDPSSCIFHKEVLK